MIELPPLYLLFENKTFYEIIEELATAESIKKYIDSEIKKIRLELSKIKEELILLYREFNNEKNEEKRELLRNIIFSKVLDYNYYKERLQNLEKRKSHLSTLSNVFNTLETQYKIYPRHLRLANFDRAEAYIMLTLATSIMDLLALSIIYGNNELLEITVNFFIPKLIIISELSLSKEGFFIKSIANIPPIPQAPEEQENTNILESIKSLINKDKENEN